MENGNPYIKIYKNVDIDYPIVQSAKVQRDFLDKTYNKIGYSCGPITLANQHGWWFLLPHDVVISWNGKREGLDGENQNNVKILSGEFYNGVKIATTESGVGQISFLFNCILETDEDHYLIISGPPNYFHEDAKPLEVIWRSDFFNYHEVSFNWIPTTANKEIIFPKGMPVMFIKNYPKLLLEKTDIFMDKLDNNKHIKDNALQYAKDRSEWFKVHDAYDFRNNYKRGIGPNHKKITDNIKINIKDLN